YFLKYGEAPACGGICFFHSVTISFATICQRRTPHKQIGINYAAFTVDLAAVVHTAVFGPAIFGNAGNTVLKLHNYHRIILALGTVAVQNGSHSGINTTYFGIPQHPAEPAHGMAAHIH